METGPEQPSLKSCAKHYRLHDHLISNEKIAEFFGMKVWNGREDYGEPSYCFFREGRCLVAIRTAPEEIAVFPMLFKNLQAKMPLLGCELK